MSLATAMAFLRAVRGSAELQRRIAASAESDEPMEGAVALAKSLGFELTEAELRDGIGQEWRFRWLRYGAAAPDRWHLHYLPPNEGESDE